MAIKDRASLVAQAETDLPDNTARSITPEKIRNMSKDLSESCVNRTTDAGVLYPKVYTVVIDIAEGETEIAHNLGKKARLVSFLNSDAKSVDFLWERDSDDELNKILVNSPVAVSDIEVNIMAFG